MEFGTLGRIYCCAPGKYNNPEPLFDDSKLFSESSPPHMLVYVYMPPVLIWFLIHFWHFHPALPAILIKYMLGSAAEEQKCMLPFSAWTMAVLHPMLREEKQRPGLCKGIEGGVSEQQKKTPPYKSSKQQHLFPDSNGCFGRCSWLPNVSLDTQIWYFHGRINRKPGVEFWV